MRAAITTATPAAGGDHELCSDGAGRTRSRRLIAPGQPRLRAVPSLLAAACR
jgi:hypothetical protein